MKTRVEKSPSTETALGSVLAVALALAACWASGPAAGAQTTDAASSETSTPAQRRMINEQNRYLSTSPEEQRAAKRREEDTWGKVKEFLKEMAPNRYKLVVERQDPQPSSPVRARLIQRWLNMQAAQINQPELYDLMVRQFRQEDHMIGVGAQLRDALMGGNPANLSDLKDQIRAAAVGLVQLNLQERQLQIQYAEKLLQQQKDDLKRDTDNQAQLALQRANFVIQQAQPGNRTAPAAGQTPPVQEDLTSPASNGPAPGH